MSGVSKAVFLALLLSVSVKSAQAELRLVANPWPPYTSNDVRNGGVATEIVTMALKRAGYRAKVALVPWSRALNGTRAGAYDLIVCAWRSGERERDFYFSDPYVENRIVFLQKAGGTWNYGGLASLRGKRVGVIRDYAYGDAFNSSKFFVRDASGDFVANVLKLVTGRVDLTVEDEFVARYEIARNLPDHQAQVDYSATPLSTNTCQSAMARDNPQAGYIIVAMNRQLAHMHSEGVIARILGVHGLTPAAAR